MKTNELQNKRLAHRPTCNKLFTEALSRRNLYLAIAFIKLCLVSGGVTSLTSSSLKPSMWMTKSFDGGEVSNLILDDRDGSVFVVVDSDIHKYSKDLKLLSSTASSPTNGTKTNDLKIQALAIIRRNNPDLLLSCWRTTDYGLKCWLNKIDNLTLGIELLWGNDKKGFTTEPSDQIKVLTDKADSYNLIITTSRYATANENASSLPYLPAMGRFKIVKSHDKFSLDEKSVLPYRNKLKDFNLHHDYVYIFIHDHHIHFILNDIRETTTSSANSHNSIRMARVCLNDTEFTSYTEISLPCKKHENLYATTAYFDTNRTEPTLHVIFEILDEKKPTARRYSSSSVLCSYSMGVIEDVFNRVVSDCNSKNQVLNLLTKLHPDSDQPPWCQRNPSESNGWCTSKANPYIDGVSDSYMFIEDNSLTLDGITRVNFFHSTSQGSAQDIYFIGTESGQLTKMNSDADLYYTIDLQSSKVKSYGIGERFTKSISNETLDHSKLARYSISDRFIIAATTRGGIHRLNIDSCYYHSTCRACLRSKDPLECVWCGESCRSSSECDTQHQHTSSCPPYVSDFKPKTGPVTGFTRLRIDGENFGSSKGSLKVKLGDQECLVDRSKSKDESIECLTKPVQQPIEVPITIEVDDDSSVIYQKGSTIVLTPFSYVNVSVYGLHPPVGSVAKSTEIRIYGQNMDAGFNRTVMLGENDCSIIDEKPDYLTCLMRAPKVAREGLNQTLKLIVDGVEQILLPRTTYKDYKLSTNFKIELSDPKLDSVVTVDSDQETEVNYFLVGLTIVTIIFVLVFVRYLVRYDIIPKWKSKLPPTFDHGRNLADAKVIYRNPHSHKFTNVNATLGGDSLNELFKINGSVMSSDYFGRLEKIDQDQPLMSSISNDEAISILSQEKILINRNKLTLGHVLGSGQFGIVYKGFLKDESTGEHTAVAVKTLHNRSSWNDTLDDRAFLKEGLMMKDFEHENVLALIGVTFDSNGLPMVITPFMLYGDLRSYISDEASSPTVKELIDFGTQIARGMAYLSNLRFVHRDLAARNCMLDENLSVKVADFGLSKDIYERDYYSSDDKKTKLPVKWMAIESLEICIYNNKTDVWSYGVLLWELMTRGVVPYPDVDNFDLLSYLKEGRRMLRPRYCPVILYKIMLSCWDENPTNRPTFDELVIKVSDVINQLKIAKDGQQKVSRNITYCDPPK